MYSLEYDSTLETTLDYFIIENALFTTDNTINQTVPERALITTGTTTTPTTKSNTYLDAVYLDANGKHTLSITPAIAIPTTAWMLIDITPMPENDTFTIDTSGNTATGV